MIVVFDQVIFHSPGKTSFLGGEGRGGNASKWRRTLSSTKINFFAPTIVTMSF
jgi:hypothetical protein